MGREQGTTGPWGATDGGWPTESWPIANPAAADVCVVGAGISGLLTAYELLRRGMTVVVLDVGRPCSGETARTTAHLTAMVDMRYARLESLHGAPAARIVAESHTAAIDRIEAIAAEEKIECGFARMPGFLAVSEAGSRGDLDAELAAATRAGLRGLAIEAVSPVGTGFGAALRVPAQAAFHPGLFLRGVAAAVVRMGGRLHHGARVTAAKGGKGAYVEIEGAGRQPAGAIVMATGSPVNDLLALHTKQAAYRTYAVAMEMPAADPGSSGGDNGNFLLWDDADPYHYVRLAELGDGDGGGRCLIVGGADHRTGQADDGAARFAMVETWARRRFPAAGAVLRRWSGQVHDPVDGLPFIGRNPMDSPNVHVISGSGGNGTTVAAIAAMIIPDLIEREAHPWAALYSPDRVTLSAAGTFARENLATGVRAIGDWLSSAEAASVEDVAPGQGALVRDGLKKLAVHRDDDGTLHVRSAVCPHLGCIVRWNGAERSWDCPCHGSRFTPDGEPLCGPASSALATSGANDSRHDETTHDQSR